MFRQHEFVRQSRKQWSSEPAFVFSMAAAAVGLGNLWRFPYMMGENGGGAFVVAYLLALVVVVLPIMMLEVAAGRLAQGSTVQTFRQINRVGTVYGWVVVLITTAITSYYLVITGWTLGYAVDAVRGDLRDFSDFTVGYNALWYFLLVTILAGVVLIRDITGIETLSKVLMPMLLVVIIGLVIVASRTPGWEDAKDFFLTIDVARFGSTTLWLFAFGQAFYTLAIGQGYLVTYGSYIPLRTHLPRACIVVAVTETCVALLAGWMIFPFVFSYGLEPDEGSQLAFVTLPRVFEEMAGGAYLAILFFGLFFAAAFSSSLAGLKVVTAAVAEEFALHNTLAVCLVIAVMMLLGTASALSFTPLEWTIAGEPVLDMIDRVAGGNVIIVSGLFGAGLFCWFVPPMRMRGVLGTQTRWFEWRIYVVGRYIPLLALAWWLITILL